MLGMRWDDEVVYQSQRTDLYQSALEKLESLNYLYPCYCTRKEVAGKPYTGTCRNKIKPKQKTCSLRIKVDNNPVGIDDQLQGQYTQRLESESGDFIIKRADGYFAYHLATIIDDADQKITEIVRGRDLLESTPRQVYIQKILGINTPTYLHLPIALDKSGKKISKSDNIKSIAKTDTVETLHKALCFLGHRPPEQLRKSSVEDILNWAIENWTITKLPKEKEITCVVD